MRKTYRNSIIFILLLTFMTQVVFGNSTESLQNQQDDINEQIKDAQDKIDAANDEREIIVAELEYAELEAKKALDELNALNSQLDKLQVELEKAREEYREAEKERDKQYELLKDRMKYMYVHGDTGYVEVLFSSDNVEDFFKRVEYINTIIKYDNEILEKLDKIEKEMDEKVKEIAQKKTEVEGLQAQQKAKTSELQEKQRAIQITLNKAENNIKQQEALVNKLQQESKRIEDLIIASQSQGNGGFTYNGGKLGWPVKGYTRLSSGYINRNNPVTGVPEFHAGIDIPAPKGTPILAAEDGRVISSGWIRGYGYTVIIDHGSGMTTLYAHNSKLNVNAGQNVVRGQKIAECGTTGNSTGNHSHFEVRLNGKHTNPLPYLQ